MLALLALSLAHADGLDCAALCNDLDAVEESCEAAYGDNDPTCFNTGALEETCDPEDGGTTESCEGLCDGIAALVTECDAALGASDAVCVGLADLATDCADGTYPGDSDAALRSLDNAPALDDETPAGCATVPGASGGLALLGLLGLVRRSRR